MEWATTADANYCHPTIRWAGYSYNNQVPIKRGAPLYCAQIVTERSQFQSIYVTFSHICAGSGAYVGRVPQGERPPSFLRYSSPGLSGKGKRHLRPAPAYCAWDRYSHHRVISARLVVPQRPRPDPLANLRPATATTLLPTRTIGARRRRLPGS